MKKKLNLLELELKLPKIDEKNTKILLGGSSYDGYDADTCNGIECGEGPNRSYPLDWGLQDPAEDDNNLDLDVSHDGSYDQDSSVDADGNSSGNSVEIPNFPAVLSSALSDGVSMNNPNFALTAMLGGPIYSQILGIFESNSVLGNLLSGYTSAGHPVTITAGVLTDPQRFAEATVPNLGSNQLTITINSSLFNSNGWAADSTGLDNIGFDFSSSSPLEDLVGTMVHEVIHAQQYLEISNLLEQNNGDLLAVRNALVAAHSEEYANNWITIDGNGNAQISINPDGIHAEMNNPENHAMIQSAIDEFRQDMLEVKTLANNLMQAIETAEAHLNDDPETQPPGGDFWNEYRDNMQHALDDLIDMWGPLLEIN